MAQDYWVDLVPPRGAYGHVGANDYIITTSNLSGKPRHARRHHARRPYPTVDYGYVPIIVDDDDYEIPDNISGTGVTARAGWKTPERNLTAEWTKTHGRAPTANETAWLQRLAARNAAVFSFEPHSPGRNDERNFNTAQNLISFYIRNGRGPDNGPPDSGKLGQPETTALINQSTSAVPPASDFFSSVANTVTHVGGDIVHTMNNAANLAGKAISGVPLVGKPLKSALSISPLVAVGGLVSKVAAGERLDRAFLETGKAQIANVRDVAPYVKMVASYVPGVGTGVAAAIAAGTALADGRTVSDAVFDAACAGIPGAIAKNVFNAVRDIAKGNSITDVAMNAALANLPPAVQSGARIAIAASKGKNVREGVLQAIRAGVPADARKALDIATALSTARNIQSHVATNVMNPAALSKLAATTRAPKILDVAKPKDAAGQKGFSSAIALVQHTGVTPTTLAAARAKMTAQEQKGFDSALKAFVNVASPNMTSLVRGGVVSRGNWRAAKAGEKGIPGRLVQNGRVVQGSYVRV